MKKQLLVLLVAVLAAGCSWSQFHGDAARTGFQPFESKIGSSTVASLSEVWTAATGPTASPPVVAGGKVYIGGGSYPNSPGTLTVFDAAGQANCTGTPKVCQPLWSATTSGWIHTTPAVVNGVVYVVDVLGGLAAYDAAGPSHCTGSPSCPLLWGADAGFGGAGAPAVSGGVLYIGGGNGDGSGRVSAYDAAGTTNCSPRPSGAGFCEPLWTASTDSPIFASVAVGRGTLYAISQNGTLYAYDAAGQTNCTGIQKVCLPLWTASAGSSSGSSPVVGGDRVYTMDGSRLLRAFDAEGATKCNGNPKTCKPLWRAQVPASPGASSFDSPAVANGRVYAGNAVYDALGVTNCSGTPTVCAPLWNVSGGGQLPVVANGIEFAGGSLTSGGAHLPLDAFDATGTSECSGTPIVCDPLWTVDPGGPIFGSPAILNGVLYVTTRGDPSTFFAPGTLHAYAPG